MVGNLVPGKPGFHAPVRNSDRTKIMIMHQKGSTCEYKICSAIKPPTLSATMHVC